MPKPNLEHSLPNLTIIKLCPTVVKDVKIYIVLIATDILHATFLKLILHHYLRRLTFYYYTIEFKKPQNMGGQ